MKIGKRLLFACAFICLSTWPVKLWALTDTPRPTATAFAYSVSHPMKPLPDSVFEQMANPESEALEEDESVEDSKPVDVRAAAPRQMSRKGLCSAVASVAKANNLPVPFFANLIWQESSFDTKTISRAGALGIAQFMPKTASEFGLINPFEPIHALNVAGKFIRELREQFGNLGLAAAAYNAGPGRVVAWMAKRSELPAETRAYVLRITGRPAADWAATDIKHDPEATLQPAKAPCVEVAEAVKAQSKIVRRAKLMMELADEARTARDKKEDKTAKPGDAAKPDDAGVPVADAGWRARALAMVRVVLQRLQHKQETAKSLKKAIRVAERQVNRDEDKLPTRDARRSEPKPIETRASADALADKDKTETASGGGARPGAKRDGRSKGNDPVRPDSAKPGVRAESRRARPVHRRGRTRMAYSRDNMYRPN